MKIHKKKLVAYKGSFQELAKELGDLSYDSLALFINELSAKLSQDGEADLARNRKKLSSQLKEAAKHLSMASDCIGKAWSICEPFTKTED